VTVTPIRRVARLISAAVTASAITAVVLGPVAAHADLVSSSPAAGASVPQANGLTVTLTFSEALKSSSKADLYGPDQRLVGTAHVDPGNNKRLTWRSTTPPAPGTWTVKWQSVAMDGHLQRNQYTFTVLAAAATASPTPPPSASASASIGPTPVSTPAPSPSSVATADGGTLLPILAALVAVGILALVLLRSRQSPSRR
jgi:copper resistance protein C